MEKNCRNSRKDDRDAPITACKSSILVMTPIAISRLSAAFSGQGYKVALKLKTVTVAGVNYISFINVKQYFMYSIYINQPFADFLDSQS